MTLRAAAEQALDTLEHVQAHIGRYDPPVVATIARSMQPTIDALRAALAAEQPQPEAQPVAWSVVFNGWVDADYTYSDRSAAESAASYLCKHKAELGPFRVVPLFAAPPPAAPEPSRTLTRGERDVFDAAERRSTKVVAPEPSEAEVAAAMASLHRAMEPAAWPSEDEITDALRAAAAARNSK